MKKVLLISLSLLLLNVTYAQNTDATRANNRDFNPSKRYLRPSLTILYIDRGGDRAERMKQLIEKYPTPDKYNNHNVTIRSFGLSNISTPQIKKYLEENISRDIVAKWFNRNSNGQFSMDLIAERGMYNATDAEVIKAKASERKTALLQDAGENLLDRSYILVFDIKKILTADEYAAAKGQPAEKEGYYADYDCYLYKLDWTDSVAAIFYNNLWVDASFSDPARVEAFNKATFPIKFIDKVSSMGYVSSTQYKDHSKNIFGSLSDEQLFAALFKKIMTETDVTLAQRVEVFKVKVSIFSTGPIKAKIGLKEGLHVDKRFFVYEFEINEKGEKQAKRKGVVRATGKITDNRQIATGETEPSQFYQVAGRKLYQGMLMQEFPDWGIGITVGYGTSSGVVGEGISGLVEMNLSLYAGRMGINLVPGIKLYGAGNFSFTNFTLKINDNASDPEFSIYGYSVGLSKDINFFRNFVLIPFVGYGIETYTNTGTNLSSDVYESDYFECGARFGLNISYNVQLLFNYSINPVLSTSAGKDNDNPSLTTEQIDLFKDQRKSGQLTCGLRIQF